MIYLFTAFYWEAQVLIEQFYLKKVLERGHFQQFTDQDAQILLTISGAGEIAAAAAVSSVCTKHPPGKEDVLLNIGICAGDAVKGSVFLIHKLTEQATGKTFYPDLLYRHPFAEAELVTCMLPWKRGTQQRMFSLERGTRQTNPEQDETAAAGEGGTRCVFDMEGAAVYQAGACYFAPHQMLFLKLVSDNGEGTPLSGQFVRQLMETRQERIGAWITQLLQMFGQQPGGIRTEPGSQWEADSIQTRQWVEQLCTDLHASKTMGELVGQLIRYAVLTGADCQAVVGRMYQERQLPCKDKREGKQCFEELKRQLL